MATEKGFSHWINRRFPLNEMWARNASRYFVPKNLNFWYFFGVFSLLVLANQIITGIWLAMYYTPTTTGAFDSVEHIMRNVRFGWLIRYLHSTGASAFFVVIYLHIYRAVMYGSYQKPRELLWLSGAVLYVLLMAEAYTGYVLPWGQMSFWATKVIISLVDALPWIGKHLAVWIQGDYTVSGITLHRFFAFHVVLLPLIIIGLVIFHLIGLHTVGSNNPEGIEVNPDGDHSKPSPDTIPFHPYYTVKDFLGVVVFLIVFAAVVFFVPTFGGYFIESANFVPANPLLTPEHIEPVWYLSPFYAILRAVPNKLLGIIAMAASIAFIFVLPWLDRSPVRSIRYKGIGSKIMLTVFVISFIGLGFLGTREPTGAYTFFSRMFTLGYFAFFVLMPIYTARERPHIPPTRIGK